MVNNNYPDKISPSPKFSKIIQSGKKICSIHRFESEKSAKHDVGGIRLVNIFNKKAKQVLKRLVNNRDGVSQMKLASHFHLYATACNQGS